MHINDTDEMSRIPEITTEELQAAINKLKNGKSPDSDGIRAEDIKACDDETREVVRQIFNEIIKQNEFTPEAWKRVKIKVLHKKGDVENVGNYCPMCSLPALYKLFSTILYRRLYSRLDSMISWYFFGLRLLNFNFFFGLVAFLMLNRVVFSSNTLTMVVLSRHVDRERCHDTSVVTSHVDHVVGLGVFSVSQVSSLG